MRMVATGLGLLVAGAARADVIVHLKAGTEMRAIRTWTEGDLVKLQLRSGVVAFRATEIASVEDAHGATGSMPATSKPANEPAAAADVAPDGDDAPVVKAAAKPPPLTVDEHVPTVANEDLQTKMERLDGLSMQTHRQLSIARRQGQPKETLEALQQKVDEINQQRMETLRKLHAIH